MHLGIADICLLDYMREGQTQEEFIRIAEQLGAQTASIRNPAPGAG